MDVYSLIMYLRTVTLEDDPLDVVTDMDPDIAGVVTNGNVTLFYVVEDSDYYRYLVKVDNVLCTAATAARLEELRGLIYLMLASDPLAPMIYAFYIDHPLLCIDLDTLATYEIDRDRIVSTLTLGQLMVIHNALSSISTIGYDVPPNVIERITRLARDIVYRQT